jgi:putative phosphoribosyl transferase
MAHDGIGIELAGAELSAVLAVPPKACALVLFAHAAGRLSPRNRHVARSLQGRGFATLLLDLLTPDETCAVATDPGIGFDVAFVADRLVQVTEWTRRDPRTADLPVCYFGASAGAAVALIAASRCSATVRAVVSRTGRADLARAVLSEVRAPSLLIVGGEDPDALAINRAALQLFGGPSKLAIAPGATHFFSDSSALDVVSQLTADWLHEHLAASIGHGPA